MPGPVEWDTNGDGIYDATGNTLSTCMLTGSSNTVTMRIGGVGGASISKSLIDVTPPCSTCGYPCCDIGGSGGGSAKLTNNTPEVTLSPNPTSGKLFINGDITRIERIDIFNQQGELVNKLIAISNEIDITTYSPGIYLFKLKYKNGEIQTIKIVKE